MGWIHSNVMFSQEWEHIKSKMPGIPVDYEQVKCIFHYLGHLETWTQIYVFDVLPYIQFTDTDQTGDHFVKEKSNMMLWII